jgi:crossover junction endodeoxyribonuclease RuvC
MNIFACDPGLNGAGAVSDERGDFIACFDLPTIGDGAQRRVDAANLADLIREHGPHAFAIVEQVGARPRQGVSSMFRFGQAYGTILGVIGALAIPVRHVSPAKWKRALGLNRDGETSRARAIETWPAKAELFVRKRDHSRAEAALLGLYAAKAASGCAQFPAVLAGVEASSRRWRVAAA